MFGDGDECQVAASHQYVTVKRKKIFPEYADSANKSGFLFFSSQFMGISNRGTETGLGIGGDHGEAALLNDGLKGLALYRASSDRPLLLSTNLELSPHPRRVSSGRPRAFRDTFPAEFHAAVHEVACAPCAIATSKRLPIVPASPRSRDVGTPGYRARQILRESPLATARCSVRDLFDQSTPPV